MKLNNTKMVKMDGQPDD